MSWIMFLDLSDYNGNHEYNFDNPNTILLHPHSSYHDNKGENVLTVNEKNKKTSF